MKLRNIPVMILCGGKGTRLEKITKNKIPKCLAPINGISFLHILVQYLQSEGFEKFIFCTGHLGGQVRQYVNGSLSSTGKVGKFEGIISQESKLLGTNGAIKLAENFLTDYEDIYVVVNGDTYCALDYKYLVSVYMRMNTKLNMSVISKSRKEVGTYIYRKGWDLFSSFVEVQDFTEFIDIGTLEGYEKVNKYLTGKKWLKNIEI